MAFSFFPAPILAAGLTFALSHSTIPGKAVLITLFFGSIFSWSVMWTKLRVIRIAKRQAADFRAHFRADRQPLRLYTLGARFDGTPLYDVYLAGCEELTFHLLGSSEVDETFRGRLEIATPISAAQMRSVESAMERAVGESSLRLESRMILLATAVSGAPFLGLLGTVWGVMKNIWRCGYGGLCEPGGDGAGGERGADHDGDGAAGGDTGDVRVQFFGHEHPGDDGG